MDSHAKAPGHPTHQLLIMFPLGLLGTAVELDPGGEVGGGVRVRVVVHPDTDT